MSEPRVAILTVTYNRVDLARRCLPQALERAEWPYDLYAADNGSTDGVARAILELKPHYHVRWDHNRGYANALNHLMAATNAPYVCVLDPDLSMSPGWLHRLVTTNQKIPNAGLSSIHCVLDSYTAQEVNGVVIHPGDKVFGAKFLSRQTIDKVGYFYCHGLYGQEDIDYNYRCRMAGLTNYYVSGVFCEHTGDDSFEQSEYRQFKWQELERANQSWMQRKKFLDETGEYYYRPENL